MFKVFKSGIVLLGCFPLLVSAFQLDWSGYYKAQGVFLHDKNKRGAVKTSGVSVSQKFYAEHYVSLSPTVRVSDGLEFKTNLAFPRLQQGKAAGAVQENENSAAVSVFKTTGSTYGKSKLKGKLKSYTDFPAGLEPTHFYGTYTGEYFRAVFGRMPFHFGLGMTYSEGAHPNEFVYDVRDGVSVELRKDDFHIKPYLLFRSTDKVDAAVSAGYKLDNVGGELLYKDTVVKGSAADSVLDYEKGTLNVSGYYKMDMMDVAFEWGSLLENFKPGPMAVVGELGLNTGFYNTNVRFFGGYSRGYTLNVNYGTAFMIWDHYMEVRNSKGLDAMPAFTDCFFAAVLAKAVLFENYEVSFLYNWLYKDNMKDGNEVVLAFAYKNNKGFKWETKVGALMQEFNASPYYGALSRAIITF